MLSERRGLDSVRFIEAHCDDSENAQLGLKIGFRDEGKVRLGDGWDGKCLLDASQVIKSCSEKCGLMVDQ